MSVYVRKLTDRDMNHSPEALCLVKHQLYGTWKSMRQRCNCTTAKDYPRYGGRGIKVCERWDKPDGVAWLGFINFVNDMGYKPGPEYQIDRVDNDKGYSPENCRWVTPKENCANRRKVYSSRGRRNTWRYGKTPYREKYNERGRQPYWRVRIPNGDGTFFSKYHLTEEESKELVETKLAERGITL